MGWSRLGVSLYVAVALHVLALLFLALQPPRQWPPGPRMGLGTPLARLDPAEQRFLAERQPPPVARTAPGQAHRPAPAGAELAAISRPPPARPAESRQRQPVAPAEARPPSRQVPDSVSASHREAPPAVPERRSSRSSPSTLPVAGSGGADVAHYFGVLRTHLAAFRHPVTLDTAEATAVVAVAVDARGYISSLQLLRSSGQASFDREALALLRRAEPLPAPPGGRTLRLEIPLRVGGD